MVSIYDHLGYSVFGSTIRLSVDQAKAFLSAQFNTLAHSLGFDLIQIAFEVHWSLIAEFYHDPPREIVNKLLIDHSTAPFSLIIEYENLTMSYKIGPEGLNPAIIAFGAQPDFRLEISTRRHRHVQIVWILCKFTQRI